jgi:hypothetical protein
VAAVPTSRHTCANARVHAVAGADPGRRRGGRDLDLASDARAPRRRLGAGPPAGRSGRASSRARRPADRPQGVGGRPYDTKPRAPTRRRVTPPSSATVATPYRVELRLVDAVDLGSPTHPLAGSRPRPPARWRRWPTRSAIASWSCAGAGARRRRAGPGHRRAGRRWRLRRPCSSSRPRRRSRPPRGPAPAGWSPSIGRRRWLASATPWSARSAGRRFARPSGRRSRGGRDAGRDPDRVHPTIAPRAGPGASTPRRAAPPISRGPWPPASGAWPAPARSRSCSSPTA